MIGMITFNLPQAFAKVPVVYCSYKTGLHEWSAYRAKCSEIDGEFEVPHEDGYFILKDILKVEQEPSGEVSSSVIFLRIPEYLSALTSPAEGRRETPMGLTARLKYLAGIAQERGCNVVWGQD